MRRTFAILFSLSALTAAAALDWTAEADSLYATRDAPGVSDQLETLLNAKLKDDPKSYEALWRLARIQYWKSESLSGDPKADAGLACWDVAKRAIETSPEGVEGLYWEATCVGARSEGMGILHALTHGLEKKFREPLDAALRVNKSYQNCSPLNAIGRYWYKLPWPKYDGDKSIAALEDAIKTCPQDLRARVYLAETWIKEGNKKRATELLDEVDKGDETYDPPEARRAKDFAKKARAKL